MLDAKGGEGASMLELGGVCDLGGLWFVSYVWYSMHSRLLSCIALHTCDGEIYVTCVLFTLTYIYMSCHLVMLIWFASAFYSDSNELYFLYSCLIHIYWVHHVGLGHISMSNSFALIVKSLYEPSMLKTSSLTHTWGCIVINHQKGEEWKHLGP